ncbi:Ig-like domain-containing protein [Glaesserella parasuis]|uniref:Ig-like domain-containing protein n=3 Tax=Glaesserella parasuis TaxID=738 RepID=UPI003CE83146
MSTIKVNLHNSEGIAKTFLVKMTKGKGKEKVTTLARPDKGIWIEFVDEKTGIAPQKIFTKRKGDDLQVFFDDKTESEPELVIKDYYDTDELPPILGKDVEGVYHSYVSELARPELEIAKLGNDTVVAQILSKEAFLFTEAFPAWWKIGAGIAGGLGLIGLATSGGGKGGAAKKAQQEAAPISVEPQENGVGDHVFTLDPKKVGALDYVYTPEGSSQPVTAKITFDKNGNPKFEGFVDAQGQLIDPSKIKTETLPDGKVKITVDESVLEDNTPVSIRATDKKGNAYPEITSPVGYDEATTNKVTEIKGTDIDGDGKANTGLVSGQTEPNADLTIYGRDEKGNLVKIGEGKANGDGTYKDIHVDLQNGKFTDIVVEAKVQNKAPSIANSETVKPVPTGDKVSNLGDTVPPAEPTNVDSSPEGQKLRDELGAKQEDVVFKDVSADAKTVVISATPENGTQPVTKEIDLTDEKALQDAGVVYDKEKGVLIIKGDQIKDNTPVTVSIKDNAGNSSTPVTSIADKAATDADKTAPASPKLTETEKGLDVELPENAPNGATVTLETTKPDGTKGPTIVYTKNDNGWDVTKDSQPATGITVDGNKSSIPASELPTGGHVAGYSKESANAEGRSPLTQADVPATEKSTTPTLEKIDVENYGDSTDVDPERIIATVKVDNAPIGTKVDLIVERGGKDVVIGTGYITDASGNIKVPAAASDLKAGEVLKVVATEPGKLPSEPAKVAGGENNAEQVLPTIPAAGKDDHIGDSIAPVTPKVSVGENGGKNDVTVSAKGDNGETLKKGENLNIGVVPSQGETNTPVELTFTMGEDNKLKPAEGTAEKAKEAGIEYTITPNNEVVIKGSSIKDNTPVTANTSDPAGNTQNAPVTVNSGFDKVTPKDAITKVGDIKAINTSGSADSDPEAFEIPVEGTPGTSVYAVDSKGNKISEPVVIGEDGKATIKATESAANNIKAGDKIGIVAQNEGAAPTAPVEKTVQPVAQDPSAHPNDQEGPGKAEISSPNAAGDIPFTLADNAQQGDTYTVEVKDKDGKVLGKADLTKQADGSYTSSNPDLVPSIKAEDNGKGLINGDKVPSGSSIKLTGSDLAGHTSPVEEETITKPESRTEKPKVTAVVAVDEKSAGDTQADKNPEKLIVKGTLDAPEGTDVLVKDENGNVIGTGKVKADKTFEVTVNDDAKDAIVSGKPFTVSAKEADKLESRPATTDSKGQVLVVPEVKDGKFDPEAFAKGEETGGHIGDTVSPSTPEISAQPQDNGDQTFGLPANPVVGDKVHATVKTEGQPEKKATLEYTDDLNGDGEKGDSGWKSNNEALVPSVPDVPAGQNGKTTPATTATIPSDQLPNGSTLTTQAEDLAGNKSPESTLKVEGKPTERTETPTVTSATSIDTTGDNNPEKVILKGNAGAENAGATVKVKDPVTGLELGSATVKEDGSFEVTATDRQATATTPAVDIKADTRLTVTVQKAGELESQPATTLNGNSETPLTAPAVNPGKYDPAAAKAGEETGGHEGDFVPPTAPELPTVSEKGIEVPLPTNPQVGDKTFIEIKDENNNPAVDENGKSKTAELTYTDDLNNDGVKGDTGWQSSNPDLVANVPTSGDNSTGNDKPTAIIPTDKLNNGESANVTNGSITGEQSGTTSSALVEKERQTTGTPEVSSLTTKDLDVPADGTADQLTAVVKTEPYSEVAITNPATGEVIARGTADAEGNVTIQQNIKDKALPTDTKLQVIATAPGKEPSAYKETALPKATEFADNEVPAKSDVGMPKANGDVPFTVPTKGVQPGETTTVEVTKPDGTKETATLTYTNDLDGNPDTKDPGFKSDNPELVANIPAGTAEGTISGSKAPTGSTVTITNTDVAGNKSEPEVAKVGESTAELVTDPTTNKPTGIALDPTAPAGTVTEVTVTTPGKDGAEPTTETVKLTKKEDGSTESSNPDLIPNVPKGDNTAEFAEGKQPTEGSTVTTTVTPPATTEGEAPKASEPKTETVGKPYSGQTDKPTVTDIKAIDTDGNGKPNTLVVEGKAEPGSTVTVESKDGKQLGTATADEQGNYRVEYTTPTGAEELTPATELVVKAQNTKAGELPSEAATTVEGKSGEEAKVAIPTEVINQGDTLLPPQPEAPKRAENGNIEIPLNPTPSVGEKQTISVTDENGNPALDANGKPKEAELTYTDDLNGDGKKDDAGWKSNNTDLVKDVPVTPAAGEGTAQPTTPTAVIEKDKLTNGDQVSTVAVSPSGNESTPSEPVTVTKDKETSTAPTEVKITAIDTSSPADATPERFIVQGKGKPGATIEIKDPTGKVVATPVVGTDGTFKADFTLEKGLEAGQKFDITATEPGKETSPKVDNTAATIPAVKAGKFDPEAFAKGQETGGHTSTIAPEAPAVETKDNGKLGINLPTNPAPGTEVTANVDTNGDGQPDSTTTYTAQPNGDWKVTTSENEDGNGQKETTESTLPKGTESAEISAPEGSKVTVSEKDPAGNESKPTEIVAPKAPEQTEAPVVDSVKSVDTNGDGKPDSITVEVTAKPGETVKVKDPKTGNVIGEAVADNNGKATVVATPESTDLTAEDKLPVTATAPGKTESEAGKTKPAEGSPEGTQGSESTVGNVTNNTPVDNTPPASTEIAPKENGDYGLEIPEDATKATVKVGDQETTLTRNEDGKLVSENPDLVKVDENGNVSIPAGVVDPSKPISVTTEDKAGNKTTDTEQNPEKITPATETTATPVLTKITAIDQSNPADDKPELVKVEGTIEEADGTVVTVTIGNQAFTAVVKDKKFEVAITDRNGFDVSANDTFKVTAKADGKLTSAESKGVDNAATPTVPAVGNTAADHTGDTTAPSAPQLSTVPGTGAVAIDLPTDAKPGDTVEVTFKKPDGNDGKVTLTRQPNGGWKSGDEALIPSVEKSDKPQAILGEDKVKDGEPVNAKSKDGFIAGKENSATSVNAGSDAKSATPTDITVKAVDTSAAADNNPEKVVVSGKAAPNADIIIEKDGKEIGRGKADDKGNFSIPVEETYGELAVGDNLTVKAKDGDKRISEATSPVAITAPAEGSEGHTGDTKAPLQATVARNSDEKGDGQVKVTVPTSTTENPLVAGDKVLVKFTPEQPENSPETTVELVYQGEGGKDGVLWKSSDESKVPSVRVGETTTTLAEDTVKDKTPVTVQTVDLAGQKATESKLESAPVDETLQAKDITVAVKDKNPQASTDPDEATIKGKVENAPEGTTVEIQDKDGKVLGTATVQNGEFTVTLTESTENTPTEATGNGTVPKDFLTKDLEIQVVTKAPNGTMEPSAPVKVTVPAVDPNNKDLHSGDTVAPQAPTVTTSANNGPTASDNEGYVKIEFPATTGENPIVEGDKVTINYTPENTDGTAGTPTTLTYTYTGGKWVQDEKDSLKLEPTNESGKWVVKLPEDKVADNTEVKAQTTDVSGKTSAESNTTKVVAPFDEKSAQPTITVKAVDVVSNGEAANNEPEKAIVTVDTTKNGQKAPKGSLVKVYKEGELNTPIGEGVIDENGKAVITITENTNGAPQDIKSTDSLVATVQEVGTDGTTPVKSPSIPSTAVQVGTPAIGKHDANNPQSGGHEGDTTAPTTAPTLEALTDDTNLGAVKVKLPEDAKDGDRVIVKFTPESTTTPPATPVEVTLTKGANGWTSDKPELIANPVNGNEVTIAKDKVKDNTEVTAVIKDLADNTTAASPNATAYPNERTKLENNSVTVAKAIDTDDVSNATPEKFTITGKSEKGAVVKAYVTHNGEKVEIGSVTVNDTNGSFSFDTTDIKKDDALKAKLTNFTFNTENGSATQITVEATKEGKAPSRAQTVNAKAAAKGQADQHTEKDAPANPTITPYMEGFGGAKVELPTPAEGETLEVEITVTPKVDTANNGTLTDGDAKKVTLTNNGGNWSVVGNTNSDLVTIKEINGKKVAIISGDKAPLGGTISATTTDFAGNKPEAVTQNLNKGPTDETAKEPDYSKDRTDVPTIKAGRTEGTGTNSDQPNAGDIVAKPGGDNDRMVVKYKDENGNAKEIAIKKDLDQGKWVVDDTATPSNSAQKADRSDYILQDDGTVIVKGQKVKDGLEAEAIGYKTVNGQGEKASNEPYETSDTTENNTRLTTVQEAKIKALVDDATPKEADAPHLVKGKENTYQQGTAIIEPQGDNEKVVVSFKGYTMTPPAMPGETNTNNQPIPTVKSQNGTSVNEDVDMVLVAQKVNGVWGLSAATKADYEKLQQAQTAPADNGENPSNLQGVGLVSAETTGIATIDPNTGKITLNANAVKDGSPVTAKGYNALGLPAEGKDAVEKTQGTNGQSDQITSNTSITVGSDLRQDQDVVADKPYLEQLSNGDMVARPQGDNTKLEVAFEKKGSNNNEKTTVTIEQGEKDISFTAEDGQTTQTAKVKVWKFSENQQNLTQDNDGDPNTMLINGVKVKLNPETGELTLDKSGLKENSNVTAVGIDAKSNRSESPAEQPVKADPTPTADPATVTPDGTIIPGGDTKEYEIFKKPLEGEGEAQSIGKVVKGEDGQWTDQGLPNGMAVDPNTGKVTVPAEQVGENNGIYVETKDGNGAISGSGEPVKPPKTDTTPDATDKPTIEQGTDANVGGLIIKPGQTTTPADTDNVRLEVSYVKEKTENGEDKPTADASTQVADGKLVATKNTQTGKWSFEKLTREVEQDGADGQKVKVTEQYDVPSTVAEINPETGEITLKAFEVMDNTQVNVTAYNNKNVPAKADPATAAANPGTVAEADQPKGPEIITVEPPPPEPPKPAEPELEPPPPVSPTDTKDSPTTFINKGIGSVEIKAGQNVDFISFTVETAQGKQNIAFIKDDNGSWEKYVMKLGDANNNDIVDGNETVEYEPVTPVQQLNGTFTVNGITSSHITNILVGKEGDDYLKPVEGTVATDNFDVSGAGHKVHSFAVKQSQTVAVPERMDVLSSGEELVSPVIQPEIVKETGKYRLKVTADPTKVSAMTFDLNTSEAFSTFYIVSDAGKWTALPGNHGYDFAKFFVAPSESEPNVFYIEEKQGGTFGINTDANGSKDDQPNNIIDDFVYGVRKNTQDNNRMDEYYWVENNPWSGGNKITLSNVNITSSAQTVSGSASTTVPSTGGSGGTNTGGDTTQPQQPPAPQKPKYETIGKPTAEQDTQNQGGVKVKPSTDSSDETKAFRVDYKDAATGMNRVIWFKKNAQDQWELDSTKANEHNGVNVSTNGTGDIRLNQTNGEVTFAPKVLKDGTKVTITAFDSQERARDNATADAVKEPQPTTPDAQIDKQGGAWVQPKGNTLKFVLTYKNEQGQNQLLEYQNKGTKDNPNWQLVSVNNQTTSQAPSGVTVQSSTGKVTIAPSAVKGNSAVTIDSYNNESIKTHGNETVTIADKIDYQDALNKLNQISSDIGAWYNERRWHVFSSTNRYDNGWLKYKLGEDTSDSWAAQLWRKGAGGNSRPLYKNAIAGDARGREWVFSNTADVAIIRSSLGYMTEDSGDIDQMKLSFKDGNDMLLIGNDMGTGYVNYSGGQPLRKIKVDMGKGNDVLLVGQDNEHYHVIQHKASGTFDIVHRSTQISNDFQRIGHMNNDAWYGGQMRNVEVNMGDGNDAILLKGVASAGANTYASADNIVYLGNGDNRFIVADGDGEAYSVRSTTIYGGNGDDLIIGPTFEKGTNIMLGSGRNKFITKRLGDAHIQMGDDSDYVEVKTSIYAGAKVNLGSGHDVFVQGAWQSGSATSIDGGSGIDHYIVKGATGFNYAQASTANIKGFERIELRGRSVFNVRIKDLVSDSGLEGPVKIYYSNKYSTKVDLGAIDDDYTQISSRGEEGLKDPSLGGNNSVWKKSNSVVDNIMGKNITFDVYYHSSESNSAYKHEVWIQQGITVI